MDLTYEQALNRAAAYCSKAEHCADEVSRKVIEWGRTPADAERIVQWLRDERFIDDARYVRAFVHDKFNYAHWGRMKIAYTLRMKHLSDALIQEALAEVSDSDDYLETLVSLLRNKMRGMELPLSQNDRAKLYRFAMQRGYESDDIGKAIKQLCNS